MESNLVAAFMNETHSDVETAYTYLQSNCWNINKALDSWRQENNINNDINGQTQYDVCKRNNDVKKLSRGISRATDNVNLVSRARSELAQNFKRNPCFKLNQHTIDTQEFTFTLPDLSIYGDEFRKFLERDLIENSTLVSLEQSRRLNWWTESISGHSLCQRLWPLATTGDGNCLLHAASLAMWGFHDRLLTLRRALHTYLESSEHRAALYRRWRWQQTKLNEQSGFVYSETEWTREWQNIVNMASTEPRRNGCATNGTSGGGSVTPENSLPNDTVPPMSASTYESLEEIHVLALAHVLRRPIVVVADVMLRDMNNEPFAPIPFGGIYLPLECATRECHRSPLLLTYDMAHFSALVAMENSEKDKGDKPCAVIPLIDSDGVLLPLQFSVDPGANYVWSETHEQNLINSFILNEKEQINLLREYLDVVDISDTTTATTSPELDSEDEIEKRFTEITDLSEGDNTLFGNKNRAAKQLQSVARQFGSIGKSMSKKLRKNFGSITKVSKSKKTDCSRNHILCAEIRTKRHEYQEEMIKNYLIFAQKRFLKEQKAKLIDDTDSNSENLRLKEQAFLEGPLKCINANCESYGTVLTSYMCNKCYETQRNEELSKINSDTRFGTGRSKFYRESDLNTYDTVKNIPVTKPNANMDRTLYLSKSTFYYDHGTPYESMDTDPMITNNNAKTNDDTNVEVTHTSEFDFGNIDQNLNTDITPVSASDDMKSSRQSLNQEEMNVNNPPGDSLQFFRNKKKFKEQKETLPPLYSIYDLNENTNQFESKSNRSQSTRPVTVSSTHIIPIKYPDIDSNADFMESSHHCRNGHCTNPVSSNTDYCIKCRKERKVTSIII